MPLFLSSILYVNMFETLYYNQFRQSKEVHVCQIDKDRDFCNINTIRKSHRELGKVGYNIRIFWEKN